MDKNKQIEELQEQLSRKIAECEELKRQDYENLKIIHNDFNQIKSLKAECARYRKALEEIEEEATSLKCFNFGYDELGIGEDIVEYAKQILDIISKAKGENNENT